jgi:ABC-2 type transport system ATP-binding protein
MSYTVALAEPSSRQSSNPRPSTIIAAAGLKKSYGATPVLTSVDLTVQSGTAFALLGPNGSGKSTLIRILSTLTRAEAGSAAVAGHDVDHDPGAVKDVISVTGQYAAVDEMLTGRENLRMIGRLRRLDRRDADVRAAQLIADFDLTEVADRVVKTYSGGTKRKLDLALSLVTRSPLIFLDEPTAGLDPRSRDALWSAIRRLVDDGVTIFLTTQYLEEADRLADRIAVLSGGRIVAEGTAAELKDRVGGEVVVLEFSSAERAARAAAATSRPLSGDGQVLEVSTDGTGTALRRLLDVLAGSDAEPVRVTVRRPSLDDVFLALTDPAEENHR